MVRNMSSLTCPILSFTCPGQVGNAYCGALLNLSQRIQIHLESQQRPFFFSSFFLFIISNHHSGINLIFQTKYIYRG